MIRLTCPNCDGSMVRYRTDSQRVGEREAHTVWRVCTTCRHMSLVEWSYSRVDNPASPQDSPGTSSTRAGQRHQATEQPVRRNSRHLL